MTSRPNKQRALAREVIDQQVAAGLEIETGGKCGHKLTGAKKGECTLAAGAGTPHWGVGYCDKHGGNSLYEAAKGAWLMGHAIARERHMTPWEALLGEVRRSAGEVAWLDWKVSTAMDDAELEPGGALHYWDKKREAQRVHLARVSKLALDAGVAERFVAQIELEGQLIGEATLRAMEATLRSLGMFSDEAMMTARGMIRTEMLALEQRVIEMNEGENEGDENPGIGG